MRSVFYVTVMVCLLSGLLAFTTAPAVAQMMSDQIMQNSGPTIEHKGPVAGPTHMGFSGEAKAGASEQTNAPGQMKSMMKGQTMGRMNQPSEPQGTEGTPPANVSAQAKGGEATVARVDRSGKCLHVYTEASASSKEIACMPKGEKVHLTGVFSKDRRWAQMDNHGWVFFRKLETDVKAPPTAAMERSWGRAAGAGKGMPSAGRHHFRGRCYCNPGYYSYPSYYGWSWGSWY
jgi:hypothetical protein